MVCFLVKLRITLKYKKHFKRSRFDIDDNYLYLGKILSIPVLIIVVKSVFQNDNKCYPQIDIHECLRMFEL